MSDPIVIGWAGLIILFIVLAMGVPIGLAMAVVGFIGYAAIAGLKGALIQLQTVPFSNVASYDLTVLPLFILMGEFASTSGLVRGTYNTMHKWLGRFPGGLAMATIAGSAAFGAVCGTSLASASTMTSVAYPEMKRFNYDDRLAAGSIACGGTLGILIPPSNPMIIYALFAQASIGRLFLGGVVPGIILSILLMLIIFAWVKMNPSIGPSSGPVTWKERFVSLKDVWPIAILVVVVMGGIWGGVIPVMEAAGIGAFFAFIIGLVKRNVNWNNVKSSLNATVKTTAMIFTILIGAMIFNYFIVMSGIPTKLAMFVENSTLPPLGVLVCILVIYLVLGCLMDTMAMTVLTLPIFLPVLNSLGFDLVWFGIIFVIMCEMALVTPPIGMNVFVISGMIKNVPMYTIFRGIWPFLFGMVICLVLVIAFPQIALYLPNSMIK
jgi:C4-dicarboxylate transporter DctM subunit